MPRDGIGSTFMWDKSKIFFLSSLFFFSSRLGSLHRLMHSTAEAAVPSTWPSYRYVRRDREPVVRKPSLSKFLWPPASLRALGK